MIWRIAHRAHPVAVKIADRHYNRQKPGTPQFVPPGRCVVLLSRLMDALWVTSWPFKEYTKHRWAGAWVNSCFRKEGSGVASEMIRDAIAVTRNKWHFPCIATPTGDCSMVTFIDPKKVRPTMRRGIPTFGYSYLKTGFRCVGTTQGGLLAFQLLQTEMPPACPVLRGDLFDGLDA